MKTTIFSLALAAASLNLIAASTSEDYVVHEWGTFTSVQGADGVLVEWNPLETTQLPRFVYDWSKPGMDRLPAGALHAGSKAAFTTLQRMETPVIYFYSGQERTVDVAVRFPQGLITEWYPQAHEIGPSAFPPNKLAAALDGLVQQAGVTPRFRLASMVGRKGIPDSRIQWKQVRILPSAKHADLAESIPTDVSGNHYFAARETDADFIQVNSPDNRKPAEHEKLLFYRGVANFKTPLNVTVGGAKEEWFGLRNTGTSELRHLFILSVRKGQGDFVHVDHLTPGEYRAVEFDAWSARSAPGEVATRLSRELKEALTKEGLYEREAAAMVKTWRDSWFEEQGLRVLYTLPRSWTDETLPLTLDPKPREVVRVMVGRAEIITPTSQWELLKQIVRFSENDPAGRLQAIARVKELALGRFIQPAVHAVLGTHPSQEFNQSAWNLVNAVLQESNGKTVARR
jgi:hypothetical protein